jgi:hypothetical protein
MQAQSLSTELAIKALVPSTELAIKALVPSLASTALEMKMSQARLFIALAPAQHADLAPDEHVASAPQAARDLIVSKETY